MTLPDDGPLENALASLISQRYWLDGLIWLANCKVLIWLVTFKNRHTFSNTQTHTQAQTLSFTHRFTYTLKHSLSHTKIHTHSNIQTETHSHTQS